MPSWVNIVNIALYVIAGLFVLYGLFDGWKKGITRQAIRVALTAVSVLLAVLAAKALFSPIANFCVEKSLWEILDELKITTVFKFSREMTEFIQSLNEIATDFLIPLVVSFFVLPLVFVFAFLVIYAILSLLNHIGLIIANFPDHNFNDIDRFFGSLFGAINGLAIVLVLLIPISGLLNCAGETAVALAENDPDSEATEEYTEFYIENIEPLNNHPVVQWTQKLGGIYLFKYFSAVEYNGEMTDMQEEAQALFRIGIHVYSLNRNADWASLSASDKASLEAIITDLSQDTYLCEFSAELLGDVRDFLAAKVDSSETLQEPTKTILSDMLACFANLDENTLKADLDTIKGVYFLLSDTGALRAMNESGDITAALARTDANGKTVIARAFDLLNQNGHASALVSSLTDVSFAVLLKDTGMDDAAMQKIAKARRDVTAAINACLALKEENFANHEDYVAAISAYIEAALVENGITLAPAVLNGIAEYIADPANFTSSAGVRKSAIAERELYEFAISYFASVAQAE